MKIADRPPYFIDPPVLSPEEEEENMLFGYITPDIPALERNLCVLVTSSDLSSTQQTIVSLPK